MQPRAVAAGHQARRAVPDGEVGDREHHVAYHWRIDGPIGRRGVAAPLLAPVDVARARVVLVRIDRMRHEPLVDVQGHLPVARPGHVRGELREDRVLAQMKRTVSSTRSLLMSARNTLPCWVGRPPTG